MTSTEKSLVQSLTEIVELTKNLNKAKEALLNHPAFKQVEEFGALLDAFAKGQPKPVAAKPTTRIRRTKEQIEAERLAREQADK